MKNIPKISFDKKSAEYEIIRVSSLFSRIPDFSDHNPTRPHRISFFALLIVTQGEGVHEIDLKKYDLKEGVVLKIAKGQVHAFQENPNYDGFLIIFTDSFVLNYFSESSTQLISHFYNYHVVTPMAIEKELNKEFVSQLFDEVNSGETYATNNIVAALIDLYLLRLERKFQGTSLENNLSSNYALFVQFKNLVESDYIHTRNVKDYAEKLFTSTKSLNQIVKEFTLNTAKNFIDDYVTLEIKRAIVSTDKNLKEIAFGSGFDEVTNFTKFFKKKTGFTPKGFRIKQH